MAKLSASDTKSVETLANADLARALGKPAELSKPHFAHAGEWAFVRGTMVDAHGKPIDFAGTLLAKPAEAGMASSTYAALLKKRATKWTLVESAVGPTDPAWLGWAEQHGAPPSLFELP